VSDWPGQALFEPGLTWSPPRHLLLDRARLSIGALPDAAQSVGSGLGVVIGIVDTGVDVTHPDLRHADGTTRVAWWIDFSSNPAGRHPELEAALGCEPELGLRCQILNASDLDERLQNTLEGDEPRDPIGHGTHVASIAAGNGLFANGTGFPGIAPEATLVVARVTGAVGTIADSDVVLATQFVFERARDLGMPAVVNLSLGGDFGAHDGSSELSQVLASFVQGEQPGRAIVVAGGNSGELRLGLSRDYPEPFGIHTELSLPEGRELALPLLTPAASFAGATTDASLFIWLNLSAAADMEVGLELPDGTRIEPVALGQVETRSAGQVVAAVVHGLGDPASPARLAAELPELSLEGVLPSAGAAVILVDGQWPAGSTFFVLLRGRGRVEAWVQSEGDLGPEAGSIGALFSGATASQTITIPAAHPALIAVGASVNRLDWVDYRGAAISVAAFPAQPRLEIGGAAFFSSAGPNAIGDIKPDLLAPGGFVIAALSGAADPRAGAFGVFSGGLCTPLGCQVVSEGYAVTAGTSMAAPMVSGAAALLFEQDPGLTQDQVRRLLQAGSVPSVAGPEWVTREGGGVLNVAASLAAMTATAPAPLDRPALDQSRLRVAAGYAVRDAARSLGALLWLRDAEGRVFDLGLERLRVEVESGVLAQGLERVAPGLYGLRVGATPDSPEAALRISVLIDERPFMTQELPIDASGRTPRPGSEGGCSVVAPAPFFGRGVPGGIWAMSLVLALFARQRPAAARLRAPRDRR
jgi:subtilisin family serine protease